MDDKEILKWFGNEDHFVACTTKEQADEVVDLLKKCGVCQGGWSTGTPHQFWGIRVSDGTIHAYGTSYHRYSFGTSFEDFMEMINPMVAVEDLI